MNKKDISQPGAIQLRFLADAPHFIEPLAEYHYEYWHESLPWWSLADALAELRDHTLRRTIPTTLIAVEGESLLGSASLVHQDLTEEDLPGLASLSPWLASVFVVPSRRGQRVGSLLVNGIVDLARELGVPRLYLFTPGQEIFYSRLGWSVLERVQHHGEPGTVMFKELSEG